MLPRCTRSGPILGSTPVQAKQIAGGGSSHCICRASKGTRGEPCATCDETASGTRMSHSKRSDVANGSRRRRGMRGSYDGRRSTCTATSGWGHEKARACVGECDGGATFQIADLARCRRSQRVPHRFHCSSAARRPRPATVATSLTAGRAFSRRSTPSLPRRRSRRRWLPARHPVASPVALPSRPDGREAPPVT